MKMEFKLKINGSESKDAEFVGWTPVKCTLTVDGYNGDATMPVTITPEHKNKSGRIELYLDNGTTAKPVQKIEHNFQSKNELTFYVAGKFGHASVAERVPGRYEGRDTFIHVKSNDSDLELKKNVMVRVRKNANKLSDVEITMFLEAFVKLNNKDSKCDYKDVYTVTPPSKLLHEIVLMHTFDTANEIHMRTSFHPWHRIFNMHLERELQAEFPEVTIPYWKFDEKAENVFTPKFIGETPITDDPVQDINEVKTPKFDKTNPLCTYSNHTIWGPLRRAYREKNPATERLKNIYTEDEIINGPESSDTFLYWSKFEERKSHNQAHNAFTGHVVDVGRDPVDPLFFMMHSNVDRLWSQWQHKHNRYDSSQQTTYPFQGKYTGARGDKWARLETANSDGIYVAGNDSVGNFAEDTLWPWDWDTVLSRPMRKWESANPGYGKGEIPQIKIEFPKSFTSHYPNGAITVKSTIDYQDRINNEKALGFDYDDTPYFDNDKKISIQIALDESKDKENFQMNFIENHINALAELRNNKNDLEIRKSAIVSIDETSEVFLDTILDIIDNSDEPVDLRVVLINEMVNAKRANKFYPSRKPRFFNILRGLIKTSNKKLSFKAIDILSSNEDPIVQDFLIEEIKMGKSDFISIPNAIFFLRQSPKPQHSKLFLKSFYESNDINIKKAAIEGLGNDPEYIELLKKVVKDSNESFKIREAGALSLHNLAHSTMNNLATQILAEPESGYGIKLFKSTKPDPDEVDFKAGLLNMLTFTGNINQMKENDGLKSSLREVVDPSTQNKTNFRTSIEKSGIVPIEGPTIIEQMAAELLSRLEENNND